METMELRSFAPITLNTTVWEVAFNDNESYQNGRTRVLRNISKRDEAIRSKRWARAIMCLFQWITYV